MVVTLRRASTLRIGFACLSIFVCIFMFFTFTNLQNRSGLHNLVREERPRYITSNVVTTHDTVVDKQTTVPTVDKGHVKSLVESVIRDMSALKRMLDTKEGQTLVEDIFKSAGMAEVAVETPRKGTIGNIVVKDNDESGKSESEPKTKQPVGKSEETRGEGKDPSGIGKETKEPSEEAKKPSEKVHGLFRCPQKPQGLLGEKTNDTINIETPNNTTLEGVAKANPHLYLGGRYAPRDCLALFKVAIIIPMRGMEYLLPGLLSHMHPIWQRQQLDYTVYIVTQSGNELFNKGKLMNAGFMEAKRDRPYDCYVFHDADLLLENDECLYWCPQAYAKTSEVIHVANLVDKFHYKHLQYQPKCMPPRFTKPMISYFGGVTSFTMDQFININGFSNIYWGWGGEDDDASMRVERKGHHVRRFPQCRFRMFKHEHVANGMNTMAKRMMNNALDRQHVDGLSTLKYKVLKTDFTPLYTNITVDVGKPSRKLKELMNNPKEWLICNGAIFMRPDTW